MKKIIVLFLFISQHFYGEDSTTVKIFKRWEIGLSFSPDYSYRVLKPVKSTDSYSIIVNKECADTLNSMEKATVAYTIGIPISYKFNKLFALKTGIYLSNKIEQSKGFVYTNSYEYGYNFFQSNQWEKTNFFFLEIPLALELTLQPKNFKKLSFKLFAGVTFCNNIEEHTYTSRRWTRYPVKPLSESSYQELYVDKFNLLYIGYTAGISAVYKLNEKLNIGIEPVFKFYGKEFDAAPTTATYSLGSLPWIYEKPYSIGCNISINYMF